MALVRHYGDVGQSNHPGFLDEDATEGHDYTYHVVAAGGDPARCPGLTLTVAQVPFFPGPWYLALAMATVAIVGIALVRTRKKA